MKLFFKASLMLALTAFVLQSCEEDKAPPSVSLDNTELSAKAGEQITIVATVAAEAGFSKITVQKFWGDAEEGSPTESTTLVDGKYSFTYTVTQDDVDPILKFRFVALDVDGQASAPVEAVVDVELTKAQILVKYDWAHTSYIRVKTGTEEISAADADDVYRFNADGTFQLSMGTEYSGFEAFYHYCYWSVNEDTGEFILSFSKLNGGWTAYDDHTEESYDLTSLTSAEMKGDITILGLDALDPDYDPEEDFTKGWSAQPRSASFDPYKPGADDDAGPMPATCFDIGS